MNLFKSTMPLWKELYPNMTPEQKKILERCYNPWGVTEKGMRIAVWLIGSTCAIFFAWVIWFCWGKF